MAKADQSYFANVVRAVVRSGFALISRVEIATGDLPHIPASCGARVTSLFFHVIGKAVIVQLAFYESDSWEGAYYWRCGLHVRFCEYRNLLQLVYKKDASGEWVFGPIPFYNSQIKSKLFPGLSWSSSDGEVMQGGAYKHLSPFGELTAPEKIAEDMRNIADQLRPFVASGFRNLQVANFPPAAVFDSCEALFWERFDTAYFKHVVPYPWGSFGRVPEPARK